MSEPTSEASLEAEHAGAIRLLADIAVLCIMPGSVAEILQTVLKRVCEFNGWQVGYAYTQLTSGQLRRVAVHVDPDAPSTLEHAAPERFVRAAELINMLLGDSKTWSVSADLGFQLPAQPEYHVVAAPIVVDHETVGILLFLSDVKPQASSEMREVMQAIGIQLGRVFERRRLQSMVSRSARLEGERIGRDLHDTVSQELAGLAMIADRLARRLRMAGSPEADAAREIDKGIRRALEGVHGAIVGLLPMGAGRGDLAEGLMQLAATTEGRYGVCCMVDCELEIAPNEASLELLLIASEAVSNAARHSGASDIRVRCFEKGDRIRLEVADNGAGFSLDTKERLGRGGRGLSIMSYRTRALDGVLAIEPAGPSGTVVTCEVPTHVLHAAEDEFEDEGPEQAVDDSDRR